MSTDREEILMYNRLKGKNKDGVILAVLNEIIERPLFLGLLHILFDRQEMFHPLLLRRYGGLSIEYEKEIVGSSRDGLKCSRVFSCGDVDTLVYSPITFDQSDERSIEYRKDFPGYFHFPQPEKLNALPAVDGIYLNSNFLRRMNMHLFPREHKPHNYTIISQELCVSEVKCAMTFSLPYSDPIPQSGSKPRPESVDFKVLSTWEMEHCLLVYLLNQRNHQQMTFLRELVYGQTIESSETLQATIKQRLGYWWNDFHMTLLGQFDLLHFDSEGFCSLLECSIDSAVVQKYHCDPSALPHGEISADLVPALKCSGWPKPAELYRTRKRLWPVQEVVDSILYSGFQIVARGCLVDPVPDKDFILSFSPSEAKLVAFLPSGAKTAYCLLKSCYKCAVGKQSQKEQKSLKSYHLKTALFWVAESSLPDSWENMDILKSVRLVVEFVIECLKKLNLPMYFIPEHNLIGDFTVADAESAINIFNEIHANPANFIRTILDSEWEYTRMTVSEESYRTMRYDRQYFSSFTWLQLMKCYTIALAQSGNYPVDELKDISYFYSHDFQSRFFQDPLNTTPSGNVADRFSISESQLEHVDIFVRTVSQNDMDLFNIINIDICPEISHHSVRGIKEHILQKYEKFNGEEDKRFGEHFLAMTKLRLKFYANVFHFLVVKLQEVGFENLHIYKNKDAVYIIRFLQQLVQKKKFNQEKIEDLLHYLLYFCHFTRQRHHMLVLTDQMLRSIREFLQDARNLMTVYFNPTLIMPTPLDLGDRMVNVLKECFLPKSLSAPTRLVDIPLD